MSLCPVRVCVCVRVLLLLLLCTLSTRERDGRGDFRHIDRDLHFFSCCSFFSGMMAVSCKKRSKKKLSIRIFLFCVTAFCLFCHPTDVYVTHCVCVYVRYVSLGRVRLKQVSPFLIPALISNTASGVVAIEHKARGPNFGVVSACATGTHAIGTAMDFMLRGEVRHVICRDVISRGGA